MIAPDAATGSEKDAQRWSAHTAFYETSVREPAAALLDELGGEFGPGRMVPGR